MDPERWRKIEALYEAARGVDAARRAAVLQEGCGGDESLRREVESLLAHGENAGRFLEVPAVEMLPEAARPAVGQRISHYEIQEKLGEGGMGVVYKAEDTRLHRTVALKFIRSGVVEDRGLKARFLTEAEAAAALIHPNICVVHEIDEADGMSFIAMEYVEGESLSEKVKKRPLPLEQALDIGIQVAEGLQAAHEKGIVHRDVKPGNILLTGRGQAKIMDFGLAHLTGRTSITKTGTVLGTPAYMSPEQVRGEETDRRTDIWSLGVLLYEMISGRLPFRGESAQSVALAIQNEEPEPPTALRSGLPVELDRTVAKALAKSAKERYQHVEDLLVDLRALKRQLESGSGEQAIAIAKKRRRWRLAAAVLAAALVVPLAIWYLARTGPDSPVQVVLLTSYPGDETYPAFSPSGDEVTFSWNGEREDNYDIYRKPIGPGETLLRLTKNPARDYSPAWSPDGRWIAFLRQIKGNQANVVLVPALPGPERTVAETDAGGLGPGHPPSHKLAWTSDSRHLVVPGIESETRARGLFLLSVDTGEKRRLTTGHDDGPALSPDGRALAFCRILGYGISDIHVVRLSGDLEPEGEPRRINGDVRATASPVWTPDGEEVVFVGSGQGGRTLWAASATGSGTPRRLPVGDGADFPAFVRNGNRLVYSRREDPRWNLWRLDLAGSDAQPAAPYRFARSTRGELWPMFSPDGKRVAFQSARSGLHQVWVCDSDGSMLRQLTFFDQGLSGSPRWSPDGGRIAFDSTAEGGAQIYVVGAEGGQPRRLTNHPGNNVPSWSRDGKWIYFSSNRSGKGELWKVAAEGGQPTQITPGSSTEVEAGTGLAIESPDAKWLYYQRGNLALRPIWRQPVDGGPATLVVPAVLARGFHVVDRGIYFVPPAEQGSSIQFLEFDTGVTRRIADLGSGFNTAGFSVSPDERSFLYALTVKPQGDLMLVENFR